ncbi:hypothetical protein EVAR_91674_1 [Eumeta japonica]|uniref:Uncharacterized protein n=1 Tax=Eumeta variegata TaxID=151549 RepID=A0A4C1Z6K7_EUMVA|nr:hypothetical protein EVAR_91674_1 [Eumeta japonica]
MIQKIRKQDIFSINYSSVQTDLPENIKLDLNELQELHDWEIRRLEATKILFGTIICLKFLNIKTVTNSGIGIVGRGANSGAGTGAKRKNGTKIRKTVTGIETRNVPEPEMKAGTKLGLTLDYLIGKIEKHIVHPRG